MTDNEIMKASECCVTDLDCLQCPYIDYDGDELCFNKLLKDILDLINRQKAEIESKNDLIHRQSDVISEQKEKLENIYSEAIKEFAERIRNSAYVSEVVEYIGKVYTISETAIKNIIKEMAGAESG